MNETLLCVLEKHYPSSLWRELAAAFRTVEDDAELLGWDHKDVGNHVRQAVEVITGSIVVTDFHLR
ncbi:MAG: hypothetical protein KDI56_07045 [Xanthomonadales bacterium]|nr:hypothetical protein [Xanthomonadales bacterium]